MICCYNSKTKISFTYFYSFLFQIIGSNMVLTCLAILAVDFRIFPRRFAKTETFGVSLMDVGVSTFIISSAITSRYARHANDGKKHVTNSRRHNKHYINQNITDCVNSGNVNEKDSIDTNTSDQMTNGIYYDKYKLYIINKVNLFFQLINWQHFIVLLLGIGRMILLKIFDYHEHVSEYGTHWNFFVTLFCVWGIVDIIHRIFSMTIIPYIAIVMLYFYQMALVYTPLTDFIFSASRTNFLYANREGIISLFGYIPMYLMAESISINLFFSDIIVNNELDGMTTMIHGDDITLPLNTNGSTIVNDISELGTKDNISFLQEKEEHIDISLPLDKLDDHQLSEIEVMNEVEEATVLNIKNEQISASKRRKRLPLVIDANNINKPLILDKSDFISNSTSNKSNICNSNTINDFIDCEFTTTTVKIHENIKNVYIWDRIGSNRQRKMYKQLLKVCLVLWILWISLSSIQETSRRLCNGTFVMFSLALNFTIILLIAMADSIGDRTGLSVEQLHGVLIRGIKMNEGGSKDVHIRGGNHHRKLSDQVEIDDGNICNSTDILHNKNEIPITNNHNHNKVGGTYNSSANIENNKLSGNYEPIRIPIKSLEFMSDMQLPVFLVANLLTGVVNMSIHTIYSSHILAFGILCSYSFAFIGFAWVLAMFRKRYNKQI